MGHWSPGDVLLRAWLTGIQRGSGHPVQRECRGTWGHMVQLPAFRARREPGENIHKLWRERKSFAFSAAALGFSR